MTRCSFCVDVESIVLVRRKIVVNEVTTRNEKNRVIVDVEIVHRDRTFVLCVYRIHANTSILCFCSVFVSLDTYINEVVIAHLPIDLNDD